MAMKVIKPTKGYSFKFSEEDMLEAKDLLKKHYNNDNMNGFFKDKLEEFIAEFKKKKAPNFNQGTLLKG